MKTKNRGYWKKKRVEENAMAVKEEERPVEESSLFFFRRGRQYVFAIVLTYDSMVSRGIREFGGQSEPPSDKLGGEIFYLARACMFVTIYIWYCTA